LKLIVVVQRRTLPRHITVCCCGLLRYCWYTNTSRMLAHIGDNVKKQLWKCRDTWYTRDSITSARPSDSQIFQTSLRDLQLTLNCKNIYMFTVFIFSLNNHNKNNKSNVNTLIVRLWKCSNHVPQHFANISFKHCSWKKDKQ
jgi:hypothetical protein